MIMNQAARAIIENYVKAADTRDTPLIDRVFHDDFRVVAVTPEGIRVLSKPDYMGLLKAGKIGGNERQLTIHSWDEAEGIGRARVTLTGDKSIFHDNLTLLQVEDDWRIVSNVTRVTSR